MWPVGRSVGYDARKPLSTSIGAQVRVGDLRHISSERDGTSRTKTPRPELWRGEAWVLRLTLLQAAIGGGISAGLIVVGTLCWCWRQRSLRKTLVALKQEDRKTLVALERPRRK